MTPPPRKLSDTDRELLAIAEERAKEAAEAVVDGVRDELTGEVPMQRTPSPVTPYRDTPAAAIHTLWCEGPDGPLGKFKREIKEQQEQRDRAMKKWIAFIGLAVTVGSLTIQLWGKWSERVDSAAALDRGRAEATAEMAQVVREVKAELTALRNHKAGVP